MAKFHINPATGNPNTCSARIQCPFGGSLSHFETKAEARADYEADQQRAQVKPASTREALDLLDKDVLRSIEALDTRRTVDGFPGGSSVQSRAQQHWSKANYLVTAYIENKDSWGERRNFYSQLNDEIRGINHELGKNSWGGPSQLHAPLVEKLTQFEATLGALTGPDGASAEKKLGFYPGTKVAVEDVPAHELMDKDQRAHVVGGRYLVSSRQAPSIGAKGQRESAYETMVIDQASGDEVLTLRGFAPSDADANHANAISLAKARVAAEKNSA